MKTIKSYKEIMMKANRYEDVISVLKSIIDKNDATYAVKMFLDKNNNPATHVDGCLVRVEADYLIRSLENERRIYSDNISNLYRYIEDCTDMMLHNYAVSLSHNQKPYIDMEKIRVYEIIQNLIDCIDLEDECDYSGWYIPNGWAKSIPNKNEESILSDLVTMETFIQQVWEIEGVRINLTPQEGSIEHLVRSYNYSRLPDDATVDDLKARINECVNKPFITVTNVMIR